MNMAVVAEDRKRRVGHGQACISQKCLLVGVNPAHRPNLKSKRLTSPLLKRKEE
jgi:hypothetical protein